MLKQWRKHNQYQTFLIEKLKTLYTNDLFKPMIINLSKVISKLYILNLDELESILSNQYPNLGRPAQMQPEIFRSFILMQSLNYHSITKWVQDLKSNPILFTLIGVEENNIPSIGSHYNFIDRFWLEIDSHKKSKVSDFKRKPKKKLKKNQKKPVKNPGVVGRLTNQLLKGRSFSRRPERLFQKIFSKIAVEPSAKLGLLGDTKSLDISLQYISFMWFCISDVVSHNQYIFMIFSSLSLVFV